MLCHFGRNFRTYVTAKITLPAMTVTDYGYGITILIDIAIRIVLTDLACSDVTFALTAEVK